MQKITPRKNIAVAVPVLLFVFLSTVILLRSYMLAITIDEAITANTFIPFRFWEIATNRHPSANNHILNTLLAKLFSNDGTWLFGIRLPAYFGFVAYYWGCVRLVKLISQTAIIQVICFVLLLTNVHLFDFYSLSRGYSLAIGAVIWMLTCMLSFFNPGQQGKHNLLLLLFWTAVMVYANYSFLNIALSGLIVFVLFYNRYFSTELLHYLKGYKIIVLLAGLGVLLPIVPLVVTHALSYGGKNNFWSDTVIGTVTYTFNLEQPISLLITVTCIILVICPVIFLLQSYRKKQFQPHVFIISIAVVWALLVNIEFYAFKIPFPIERTALCFFPFLVLFVVFLLAYLHRYKPLRLMMYMLPIVLIGLIMLDFSFYRTKDWSNDNFSKRIAQIIYDNSANQKCAIQSHWLFEPAIRYHLKLIKPTIVFTIKEKDSTADFIIDGPTQMRYEQQYLFINKEMPMGLRKK